MKKLPLIGLALGLIVTAALLWKKYSRLDGVLRFAVNSEISSLDPALAFDDASLTAIAQSYETLYEYHYHKRPYELVPLLAQGMPEISAGPTVTIKIRPNIFYHPHPALSAKRQVIAQDFVNQIKRLLVPSLESPGANFFQDILVGAREFQQIMDVHPEKIWEIPLAGVQATDDFTLVFRLKQNAPHFLNLLGMTFVCPLPLEVLRLGGDWAKNIMVGTGPYKLVAKEDRRLKFEAFEHYRETFYPDQGDRIAHMENWLEDSGRRLPFMKKAILEIMPESDLRWQKYLDGQLDWTDVPDNAISTVMRPDGLLQDAYKSNHDLQIYPRYSGRWLAFNMNHPVWGKRPLLRQALAWAIDRETYIGTLTGQTALPANSIYFPGVRGHRPNKDVPFSFNLAKARALLKEAGHANAKGLPPLHYFTRGTGEQATNEAKLVQSMLEKIGIKMEIHPLSFPQFLTQGRQGKLEFFTDGWIMDYPDPSNILQLLSAKNHPGINKSAYKNSQFEEAYAEYFALNSEEAMSEKGEALLNKMEKIVMEDLPWIMLYIHRGHIISQKNIKNLRSSTFIRNYLKYIRKD